MAQARQLSEHPVEEPLMVEPPHYVVEPHSVEYAQSHHHEQLNRRACTKLIAHQPTENIEEIDGYDSHRGAHMRETNLDEEMVQVRLVGMKRRNALQY